PNGGTGSVAWNFSAQDNTFDFLAAGQTVSLTYTVQVKDSQNATASQLVTVTIHGTNDVPVIGGVSTGAVTEDVGVAAGSLTTGGALTIADVDQGQSNFTAQPGTAGSNGYGTFTLAASGAWTYSADDSQAAIQQLGAGQSLTDSFTAVSSDGTASQLVTVTIHGTNDVPVLNAAGGSLSYTENQAATAIDTVLTTSDVDSTNLTGATVSITANLVSGQDVLGFTNQNGITGSFNAATGLLTLTGSSSVANYQAALRSVTYSNSSDNPSGATRAISYQVDDGSAANHASNIVTATVSVTSVNDAPTTSNNTVTTKEDTAYTF